NCTGTSAPCPNTQTLTCAPYICDGTACGTACTGDTECTLDHYCSSNLCTPKVPNGEPCSAANQCTSGICTDGFCCNSSCTGQCEACDVPTQEGACVATTGTPHGARPACDTDGTVCGGACDGSNRAGCLYPTSTTLCRAPSCTSNTATLPAGCQGDGTCPAEQFQDCSPFVCGPTACVGNCTADVQCQSGTQYCSAGICVDKLANGSACGAAHQCTSGMCVDGVCCNSACTGQCEACNVGGSEGTCSAVSGDPVGGRAPCQTDGSTCGGSCDGTDRQACVYPGFGVECRAEACSNDVATLSASCNGAGSCPPAIQQSCAPGTCSGDRCDGGCLVDSHCNVGEFCAAGVCQAQKSNGATCSAASQCVSGNCVDGYCCNSACTGQCEACDASGSEGACSPIAGSPHGTRQACTSDGSACGGFCDGTNAAACSYAGGSTVCRPADCSDNVATVEATCVGNGRCPTLEQQACPPPNTCSGTICGGGCTTNTDCQTDQYCSGGVCVGKRANGAACTTNAGCSSDSCVDGVCCDTACNGQCEACDVVGQVGTCTLVTGQPHGGRTACLGSGACGAVCDGSGTSCVFPGGTTECGLGSCADGVSIDAPVCNGAGTCLAPTATDCSPYLCGMDGCNTSCTTNADCATGFECEGDTCVSPVQDGGVDAGTGGSAGQAGAGGNGTTSGGTSAGGSQSTGGSAGSGLPDAGLDAGVDAGTFKLPDEDGGCGCRVPGQGNPRGHSGALWLGLGLVLWAARRRQPRLQG
ncbi:MAG: MYXO-CTERM sorting domain-containing protein, partial [Polyangiaceae bacterium]